MGCVRAGELHLSILIENMRREGFELQVSKPKVIIKEIDGVKCEPVERVQIDTPEEYTGSIIESLGSRKGEMLDMINNGNGQVRLIFNVPARIDRLYDRIYDAHKRLRHFKPYV